jgi:hypothetical protein
MFTPSHSSYSIITNPKPKQVNYNMRTVATPLWAKCEDETHTPKKWELRVLRDSRNFKAQQ